MNFGSRFTPVSFFTPAVPPFPAGAADNGLSVDPVTGLIVLGNDVGDATEPARLLNAREIVTDDALGNFYALNLNSVNYGVNTALNGQDITITAGAGAFAFPFITTQGADNSFVSNNIISGDFGQSQSLIQSGDFSQAGVDVVTGNLGLSYLHISSTDFNNQFFINADGQGFINMAVRGAGGLDFLRTDVASLNSQFSNNSMQTFNGATLQVSGTLTHRELVNGFSGNRNVDRDIDSSRFLYNTAAGTLLLPNMAAANTRLGFNLRFSCNNAAGITVQADAGQTILIGASASSVAGTISSTTVGSFGRISLLDSFTWVVENFTGTWVIT